MHSRAKTTRSWEKNVAEGDEEFQDGVGYQDGGTLRSYELQAFGKLIPDKSPRKQWNNLKFVHFHLCL